MRPTICAKRISSEVKSRKRARRAGSLMVWCCRCGVFINKSRLASAGRATRRHPSIPVDPPFFVKPLRKKCQKHTLPLNNLDSVLDPRRNRSQSLHRIHLQPHEPRNGQGHLSLHWRRPLIAGHPQFCLPHHLPLPRPDLPRRIRSKWHGRPARGFEWHGRLARAPTHASRVRTGSVSLPVQKDGESREHAFSVERCGSNANGVVSFSPGLATQSPTLGNDEKKHATPTGLRPLSRFAEHNPVGVDDLIPVAGIPRSRTIKKRL